MLSSITELWRDQNFQSGVYKPCDYGTFLLWNHSYFAIIRPPSHPWPPWPPKHKDSYRKISHPWRKAFLVPADVGPSRKITPTGQAALWSKRLGSYPESPRVTFVDLLQSGQHLGTSYSGLKWRPASSEGDDTQGNFCCQVMTFLLILGNKFLFKKLWSAVGSFHPDPVAPCLTQLTIGWQHCSKNCPVYYHFWSAAPKLGWQKTGRISQPRLKATNVWLYYSDASSVGLWLWLWYEGLYILNLKENSQVKECNCIPWYQLLTH